MGLSPTPRVPTLEPPMSTPRLGEILVSERIVPAEVVQRALDAQRRAPRRRLGDLLIEAGALQPAWLTAALALQAGVETVDPLALQVDPATLWRVPPDVAQREGVLVARDEDGVLLVVQDPSNVRSHRAIASLLGLSTVRIAAGLPARVTAAIARHYDLGPSQARRPPGLTGEERPAHTSPTSAELDTRVMLARLGRQGPRSVQDFVTALLAHAVETGAERLGFDAGRLTITYDGVDRLLLELPAAQAYAVGNRLRVVARLDVGATRAGNVGSTIVLGSTSVEVAARSTPGASGGRVELDLLPDGVPVLAEMNPRVATAWRAVLAAPGLVVVATPEGTPPGPLPELPARAERCVITDAESLSRAIRLVEAGRTVMAAVSAPGVPEALARLRDLAPSRSALATALVAALATRRLRTLCTHCAQPAELDQPGAERLGVVPFAAPRPGSGCPECAYRRYRGSVWCFELVTANPALRDAIDTGASITEIGARCVPTAARAMQVDAVAHAIVGLTSSEELHRAVPARPTWGTPKAEDRHRGLLRAVTDAPSELDDDPITEDLSAARPIVLLMQPTDAVTNALRGLLGARVRLMAVSSAAEALSLSAVRAASVAVFAKGPKGAWDADLVADLRQKGTRVILLGAPNDLGDLATAFRIGADDYAGSREELALRVARWSPDVAVPAPVRARVG